MKKLWNPGTVLSAKSSKYLALNIIIEFNGRRLEIFAVEVGDWEYCSKSVYVVLKNWISIILLSARLLKS